MKRPRQRHELTLALSSKMDGGGLWQATCSCGGYSSAPGSESHARTAGEAHVAAFREYTCPRCQAVSHNPHDVSERYCGKCHKYEDEGKNDRLNQLLAEANCCWCGRGRCCRVHQTHTMPHVGCVLR